MDSVSLNTFLTAYQTITPLKLGELWAYRELLYFLTWRDVTVRYKQTALGVAWAILQPLATMLLFTIFFGHLAKIPSEGLPYALFSYSGLVLWTFFSNGLTLSSNSLVASSNQDRCARAPRTLPRPSAATKQE